MLSSLDATVKAIALCHSRVHNVYIAAHNFSTNANAKDFATWRLHLFSDTGVLSSQKENVPAVAKFYLEQADNMLFLSGALVNMLKNMIAVSEFAYLNGVITPCVHTSVNNAESNVIAHKHLSVVHDQWQDMCNRWCSLPTKYYFNASFAFHYWLKQDKCNAFQTHQPDPSYTLCSVDYCRGEFLSILNRKRATKQIVRWGDFTNSMLTIYLNTRCIESRRDIQLEWAEMLLVVPPSSIRLAYQKSSSKASSQCGTILTQASQEYIYFVTHFVLALMHYGCAEQGVSEFFAELPGTTEAQKRQFLQLTKDIWHTTDRWLNEWLGTKDLEEENREVCLEVASTYLLVIAKGDARMAPMDAPTWSNKQIQILQTYQHNLLTMLKSDGTCIPLRQRRAGHASASYIMLDYHLHYLACVFFVNLHNAQVEHAVTKPLDVLKSVRKYRSLKPTTIGMKNSNTKETESPKRRFTRDEVKESNNDNNTQARKRQKAEVAETLRKEGVVFLKHAIDAGSVERLRQSVCAPHAQTSELKRTSWLLNPFISESDDNKLHLRLVGAAQSAQSKITTLTRELSKNPLLNDLLRHDQTNRLAASVRSLTNPSVHIMEDELYLRQKVKNANTTVHADIFYYKNNSGLFDVYRQQQVPMDKNNINKQDMCNICLKSVAVCQTDVSEGVHSEQDNVNTGSTVLICDRCECTYHNDCLNDPLIVLPHGEWHCKSCSEKFVDAYTVWIPLHDIDTRTESCLAVVPGSHLWTGFDTSLANRFWIPFDTSNLTNLRTLPSQWYVPDTQIEQGDVIVFNNKLIHAATTHGKKNDADSIQADNNTVSRVRHSMDARFVGLL